MTKRDLFLTSWVAALPGALLAFLMLLAILGHMEGMPLILMIVAIVMFGLALAMACFPFYILAFYGRKAGGAVKKAKTEKAAKADATQVAPAAAAAAAAPASDEFAASDEMVSDEFVADDAEEAFEPSGDFDSAADDDFEFEDFEDDEK